jgi:hypothetical protein
LLIFYASNSVPVTKNTDVTALALAKLNPGLPDALMAEWAPAPEFDPHDNDPDIPVLKSHLPKHRHTHPGTQNRSEKEPKSMSGRERAL